MLPSHCLREKSVSRLSQSLDYHILKVDKIRGQEIDVRHIILFPELTKAAINEAKDRIETIRTSIVSTTAYPLVERLVYTLMIAAHATMEGSLVNPTNQDTRFDLTKMDPTLSAQVYNLAENEVSKIFVDQDRTGKKTYKILTVTNKYEEHPADFVKDYEKIKSLALRQKQIKTIEQWQEQKIKDTYVNVNKDYRECVFASDWVKK